MKKLLSKPTITAAKPPMLHIFVRAVAKGILRNIEHTGLGWHEKKQIWVWQ